MVVYKYEIPVADNFDLELPKGAKLLTVRQQRGAVQLCALVDPSKNKEQRSFRIALTGIPIEEGALEYCGTYHLSEGALDIHLFEVLPIRREM